MTGSQHQAQQQQKQKQELKQQTQNVEVKRKTFSLNISGKEEVLAQYNAKLEKMKKTLNSLIPDPGMTPQMQCDYYTCLLYTSRCV